MNSTPWGKISLIILLLVLLFGGSTFYLQKKGRINLPFLENLVGKESDNQGIQSAADKESEISFSGSKDSQIQIEGPNVVKGAVLDKTLKEEIEGVILIAAAGTDQFPADTEIVNPLKYASENSIDSRNYAIQAGIKGFSFDIPTDAKVIRVAAPCYKTRDFNREEIENGIKITLERTCKDNYIFGQVTDSVTSRSIQTKILLETTEDSKQIDTDTDGYYSLSIPNSKEIKFIISITKPGYKTDGFKAAIDPKQAATNTWRDLTLVPDLQGATL